MGGPKADRTGDVPTFSITERSRRWSDIRERMAQRRLDALLVWGSNYNRGLGNANLRYLTHVPASSRAVALFPARGEPVVFSELHHSHVPYSPYDPYQNWVDDTRPMEAVDEVVDELSERGLDTGRIGLVGFGNQYAPPFVLLKPDYEAVSRGLPDAEIVDATDLLERARLTKSDEEIDMLRRAGTIGREMADDLVDATPGERECEVYARMTGTQIARGGEPYVFNLFDSGSPTADSFEHLLHGKPEPLAPTRRTLDRGDLLMTEYHAGYGGLLVGVEKSVVLGSPPEELEDVHAVCLDSLDAGVDALGPGATFGEVVDAIRAPVREAGMDFVELGLHGHGYGSPEFPTAVYANEPTPAYPEGMSDSPLSERGVEDVRIRPGMVFALNIDVYDPDWREDVGLMLGDTVHVTESGSVLLVDVPRELAV